MKSLTKQKSTTNLNLWRRFSRKNPDKEVGNVQNPDKGLGDIQNPDKGLDDIQNPDKGLSDIQSNPEENMDAPNSPWRRKSEPTVSFQENIGTYQVLTLRFLSNKRVEYKHIERDRYIDRKIVIVGRIFFLKIINGHKGKKIIIFSLDLVLYISK